MSIMIMSLRMLQPINFKSDLRSNYQRLIVVICLIFVLYTIQCIVASIVVT